MANASSSGSASVSMLQRARVFEDRSVPLRNARDLRQIRQLMFWAHLRFGRRPNGVVAPSASMPYDHICSCQDDLVVSFENCVLDFRFRLMGVDSVFLRCLCHQEILGKVTAVFETKTCRASGSHAPKRWTCWGVTEGPQKWRLWPTGVDHGERQFENHILFVMFCNLGEINSSHASSCTFFCNKCLNETLDAWTHVTYWLAFQDRFTTSMTLFMFKLALPASE